MHIIPKDYIEFYRGCDSGNERVSKSILRAYNIKLNANHQIQYKFGDYNH